MKYLAPVLATTLLLAACGHIATAQELRATALNAQAATHGFSNPVLDVDFPDPCIMRAADNNYYAYATQGGHDGKTDNISVARSADMVHWDRLKDAMPTKPDWASKTQNFWAPHVMKRGSRYVMYYAAQQNEPKGSKGFHMGLGVATATSPAGPFTPAPKPLTVEDGFSAIDPFVMDDPASGKPYMFWGSGFQPIRARQLRADGLDFAPNAPVKAVLAPRNQAYEHLIEGAWVRQHDGWYYLFYSGDNCCTDDAQTGAPTYAVMVARSKSITGPYERLQNDDGNARPILHGDDRWLAPGHNAIVTDAANTDWIVYHAIDARQRTTPGTKDLRRCLLIDPVSYVDGWPRIANDAPSMISIPAPKVR